MSKNNSKNSNQLKVSNKKTDDLPPLFAAAIDIGSNDIRMKIGQRAKGHFKLLEALFYPLSLGRDTFTDLLGKITYEKTAKLCGIINNYVQVASEYGVESHNIRVVATTAVREATNQEYVLDLINLKTGLRVDVLDDQIEKTYLYKVMMGTLTPEVKQSALMVHIGSGNLGIAAIENEKIPFSKSLKIGSLRLNEIFDDVQEYSKEFHLIVEEYLSSFIDTVDPYVPRETKHFVATGGEITLISKLCGAEVTDGTIFINREKFNAMYDNIKRKSANIIAAEYDIPVDKAEILFPASCIYDRLFALTDANGIISPYVDLSDAVLLELLYPEEYSKLKKDFYKNAIQSSKIFAKAHGCNESHFSAVEKFSLKIFDKIKKLHGLGQRERSLLQIAAILCDVGKSVNVRTPYRYSYQIIRGLDLLNLTSRDIEMIANIAFYQSAQSPSKNDENYKSLLKSERVTVAKLSAILIMANSLDRSFKQKFDDIDVKMEDDVLVITANTNKNIELEQWSFNNKTVIFTEVFGIKSILKQKKVI